MTSTVSVAGLTNQIGEFADLVSAGMRKPVSKHFREYLLGIMIPPEVRRKVFPAYLSRSPRAIRAQ